MDYLVTVLNMEESWKHIRQYQPIQLGFETGMPPAKLSKNGIALGPVPGKKHIGIAIFEMPN